MLTSVRGVYHNGKVELAEQPDHVADLTPVIVTFLDRSGVNLHARGLNERQVAELRAKLETFAEDWDSPEMGVYDDYDAAKTGLQTR